MGEDQLCNNNAIMLLIPECECQGEDDSDQLFNNVIMLLIPECECLGEGAWFRSIV